MNARSLPEGWEEVWGDFEILKRHSLSERTLANYRDTLVQLAKFVGTEARTMENLTRRQVAAFLEHVAQTTSATTAAMRYRGLSAVFNWLANPDEDDPSLIDKISEIEMAMQRESLAGPVIDGEITALPPHVEGEDE